MEPPPDCAVALVPYYPVRGPTFGDQAVAFPRETPSRNTGVAPELRRSTGALYRFILTLGGMGTNVAGITPAAFPRETPMESPPDCAVALVPIPLYINIGVCRLLGLYTRVLTSATMESAVPLLGRSSCRCDACRGRRRSVSPVASHLSMT